MIIFLKAVITTASVKDLTKYCICTWTKANTAINSLTSRSFTLQTVWRHSVNRKEILYFAVFPGWKWEMVLETRDWRIGKPEKMLLANEVLCICLFLFRDSLPNLRPDWSRAETAPGALPWAEQQPRKLGGNLPSWTCRHSRLLLLWPGSQVRSGSARLEFLRKHTRASTRDNQPTHNDQTHTQTKSTDKPN